MTGAEIWESNHEGKPQLAIISDRDEADVDSVICDTPENDSCPFPPLPVELVRLILEVAALAQSPPRALELLLISKAVRHWLTPVIYRYVQWLWDQRVEQRLGIFCRTVERPELARCVRGLVVFFSESTYANVVTIFTLCANLDSVTIFGHKSLKELPIESMANCAGPSYVCFAIPISGQTLPPPIHPFLRNVKCLFMAYILQEDIPVIHALPKLTHFATYTMSSAVTHHDAANRRAQISKDILLSPSIQSFVLLFKSLKERSENDYAQEPWPTWVRVEDERFIVRVMFKGEFPTSVMAPCDIRFWRDSERMCRDWREDVKASTVATS